MRRSRLLSTALSASLVVAVLAGCSGDDDPAAGTSPAPTSAAASSSASTAATPSAPTTGAATTAAPAPSTAPGESNGVEKLPAAEIVARAKAAAEKATSVHFKGTFGDGTQTVALDVRASESGNGTGELDFGNFAFRSVRVGDTVYFKGDDKFLALLGPPAAAAKGKYIKAKVTDQRWKQFAAFTDSDDFLRNLFEPDGTLEVGERKKIGDTDVVGVVSENGREGGILWIATRGEPLPVFVEPNRTSTAKGGIAFSEWNVPVRAVAPSPGDVVEIPAPSSAATG